MTLEFFKNRIIPEESFKKLFGVLTLTQKGLSIDEIQRIITISDAKWHMVLVFFKSFFMLYKGLWKNNNDFLKRKVEFRYLNDPLYVQSLHREIAKSLEHTPNSIRKLEEETYNLDCAQEYFILKQVVSNIESFLLLFNPLNKYDLCRNWKTLERKGYDPVKEYNKAIELFDMHHLPPSEDLFKIIIQISRFLKEFSDFETLETPDFRHPCIKNKILDISVAKCPKPQESSIAQSKKVLNKNGSKSKLPPLPMRPHTNPFLQERDEIEIDWSSERNQTKESNSSGRNVQVRGVQREKVDFLEFIGLLGELDHLELLEEGSSPLLPFEEANLENPLGRKIFREHHLNILRLENKNWYSHKETREKTEDGHSESCAFEVNLEDPDHSKTTEGRLEDRNLDGFMKQEPSKEEVVALSPLSEIDLKIKKEKPSQNYYYKRWVWLIFPWVSISADPRHQFSSEMGRCYSSSNKYMSVQEEKIFTKQALEIAIEAKQKKIAIYSKTEPAKEPQSLGNRKPSDPKLFNRTMSQASNRSKDMKRSESESILISKGGELIFATRGSRIRSDHLMSFKYKKNSIFITTAEGTRMETQERSRVETGDKESLFFLTEDPSSLAEYRPRPREEKNKGKLRIHGGCDRSKERGSSFEKSKFGDESLRSLGLEKGISHFMGSQLQSGVSSVLSHLKDNMMEISEKELYFLQRKHDKLVRQFNFLVTEKREKKNLLSLLKGSLQSCSIVASDKKLNEEEVIRSKLDILNQKLRESDQKFDGEMRLKDRMNKIITICDINKEQDQLWIRALNGAIANYRKAVELEKRNLAKLKEEIEELERLNSSFRSCYVEKFRSHSILLSEIESNAREQNKQDVQVAETSKIIETKKLGISSGFGTVDQDFKEKTTSDEVQRERGLSNKMERSPSIGKPAKNTKSDLALYESQYSLCREIFEMKDNEKDESGGKGNSQFYETRKFKEFKEKIERNRHLKVVHRHFTSLQTSGWH